MDQNRTSDLPAGLRLYAIGDIHGRLDLFEHVCTEIERDLATRPVADARLILLGDYIDRGQASAGVVEKLSTYKTPAPPVCLRGNHEAMLQAFLTDPACLDAWRHFGGLDTLASYGLDIADASLGHGYLEAQHALMRRMPPHHLVFFADLQNCFEIGPYFFCHAGVRPNVALAQQKEEDLLWIREPFLESNTDFGRMIIHGHTPVKEPDFRNNRINLDTGAYFSERLTCLVLERGTRRLLV